MSRATRAIVYLLCLFLVHVAVLCILVSFFPTTILTSTKSPHLSHYERIPKSEMQRSLVIVSDMTSHFGRAVALKMADMGFYVLAGVRTENDRRAYTGYNTVKGLESFVLDIVDPMDMVQMTYRVTQIEQKYNRSLYGLIVVDTYQTDDVVIPASDWIKHNRLRKKLMAASTIDSSGNRNETLSVQDREALFHMNTKNMFNIYDIHTTYQHVFQGPYRLLQACYDLANSAHSSNFRVTYLRPSIVSSFKLAPLFSQDSVAHAKEFLAARGNDPTTRAPPRPPMRSTLSLVEYPHMPPAHTLAPRSPPKRKAQKRAKKSPPSEPMSTTSTPSSVPEEDITRAVMHSLLALQPEASYRLGHVQLNLTQLDELYSDFSTLRWHVHRDTMTCSADYADDAAACDGEVGESVAPEPLETTCRRLVFVALDVAWRIACTVLSRGWRWWFSTPIVKVPIAVLDKLFNLFLPPVLAEMVWEAAILPSLIGVA